ncbi:phospholipase effector Tle1 domain-containing protein [Enterobacter wuhouensis]|uniref:phospholipase effector Tle1 domain-containing protein n=1 Tax=Enterobacter wuhouensis TaxID=2529381 RepID=UPI003523DD18
MAFDLDVCIAAANRASQACEYELGNCSRTLHIGLFFDGVGRNIEQDAPDNRLSNVARLYRAFPTPVNNTPSSVYQAHYISGLGTPFLEMEGEALQQFMDGTGNAVKDSLKDQPTDALKDIFKAKSGGASNQNVRNELRQKLLTPKGQLKQLRDATLKGAIRADIEATPWLRDNEFIAYSTVSGADTRLNSTRIRFERTVEDALKQGEVPLRLISVSVFGFDMGGTQARQFIDLLLNDLCVQREDGKPAFKGIPVDIVFAGLFDCSRDTPMSSDNGLDYAGSVLEWAPVKHAETAGQIISMFGRKYLDHQSPLPEAVKHSLHLVAAHERRRWRCVYRTGRKGFQHKEVLMPGCSDDIGGGLKPDVQKPSAELSRVPLRKMYQEAMKAGVPFHNIKTLREVSATVASYFSIQDSVKSQSVDQWVETYQSAINAQTLSYQALNRHLDDYFEWLSRQFYEYKSELRRLEGIRNGIMTSTSSASGLLGLSSQARQEMDSVTEDIATLKKHWGWLSDVASAASLLLTQKFYYPPKIYLDNILEPALLRARRYLDCGTAGHDGKAPPVKWCMGASVLYAWFIHDVQRAEGINDGYFSVRWLEPR